MGHYCSAFAKIIAKVCSAYIRRDNVHRKLLLQPAVEAVTCYYTNKEVLTNKYWYSFLGNKKPLIDCYSAKEALTDIASCSLLGNKLRMHTYMISLLYDTCHNKDITLSCLHGLLPHNNILTNTCS